MDGNRSPIGIFDSGIGGLTVFKEVSVLCPDESLLYFGDTAHVPYGNKSSKAITHYSIEIVKFLLERGVKLIIVACNSASAVALKAVELISPVPVIGVIDPGVRAVISHTRSERVGVIGTRATIESEIYSRSIKKELPGAEVKSVACPLFVPIVEEQWQEHPIAEAIIEESLLPFRGSEIDTLLLGCTHYPLLKRRIQQHVGEEVQVIDSAVASASYVREYLVGNGMESSRGGEPPQYQFYTSDCPKKFVAMGRQIFSALEEAAEVSLDQASITPLN